jgi:hypothetical protein
MHGEPLLAWPAADDRNAAESCHESDAPPIIVGAEGELQSCAGNSSTILRPAACYRAAKFFADAAVICGIA